MKRLLALFVLLWAGCRHARPASADAAADGQSAYDWQLVSSGADGESIYFSFRTMARTAQGTVLAWSKLTWPNGNRKAIGRLEYDCRGRWRMLSAMSYDPDGDIIDSRIDGPPSPWNDVLPETAAQDYQRIVCGPSRGPLRGAGSSARSRPRGGR